MASRKSDYKSGLLDLTAEQMEKVVGRLMSKRAETRMRAAFILTRAGRPALARAIELTRDPRPRMREMACTVLGQAGSCDFSLPGQVTGYEVHYREGVPDLLRLLEEDPAPAVRSSAAAALGFQVQPETLPFLCRGAYDSSADVRFGVVNGLEAFRSYFWEANDTVPYRQEVISTLLHLMNDSDEDVRDWATFSIHQGRHDTPETRARLWQALDDPNPDVRGEAAAGLAIFGDRDLIPRLDRLLREDEDLPPTYFQAAQDLEDPILLDAVQIGAERWRADMAPGEAMHMYVTSALEHLQSLKRV
jgi:HEAT repeat protein